MNDAVKLEAPMVGPDHYDPIWDDLDGGMPGLPAGHYDKAGNAISMRDWCRLRRIDFDKYARVAQDSIGPYWISTVWLGMDHSSGRAKPIIFETMVFLRFDKPKHIVVEGNEVFSGFEYDRDNEDVGQWRYSTLREAEQGHRRIVAEVEAAIEAGKKYRGYE